jgi:hypothetical protein
MVRPLAVARSRAVVARVSVEGELLRIGVAFRG